MSKVLIIGAGGVGTVVAHKCAQNPDVFNEIVIASRTQSKCDAVARAIGKPNIVTGSLSLWARNCLKKISMNCCTVHYFLLPLYVNVRIKVKTACILDS